MSYPPNQDGYTQPYQPPQWQGQPGPQWQGQPWQPPPPAPKKSRAWLWVVVSIAGVFTLCLVIGAIQNFTGHGRAKTTADTAQAAGPAKTATPAAKKPAATTAAAKAPTAPGLGDKVRDGKFEFVATGMDCSKTRVGDEYLHTDAQGKFCVVALTVKNIGTEAQTFTGTAQKAYDASGASFDDDTGAELYANKSAETFLNDINPGNTVHGKVIFDVPKTTVLTTIELHDSSWSGGVKVSLH